MSSPITCRCGAVYPPRAFSALPSPEGGRSIQYIDGEAVCVYRLCRCGTSLAIGWSDLDEHDRSRFLALERYRVAHQKQLVFAASRISGTFKVYGGDQ